MPAPTRPQGPYPQLSYHDQVGVTVILLHGDLDILSVPALEAYLNDIRSRGRLRSVADLTALTFIDCACLTVLVRYCQEVRARGGSFALAGAHDTVYRSFPSPACLHGSTSTTPLRRPSPPPSGASSLFGPVGPFGPSAMMAT